MPFKKVVKSAIVFSDEGKYLYGFYSEEAFASHMAGCRERDEFAYEVDPNVAVYIRDHLLKDEYKTGDFVCNPLED